MLTRFGAALGVIMPNLLAECRVGDVVRLPLGRPVAVRGSAIGSAWWLGLGNKALAAYALQDQELFLLVWGMAGARTDPGETPASLYFDAAGRVDPLAPGCRRVLARVGRMRRQWAFAWRSLMGLILTERDTVADRVMAAEAFRFLGEALVSAGRAGALGGPAPGNAGALDAGVYWPVRSVSAHPCFKQGLKPVGEGANSAFELWFRGSVMGWGIQGAARWVARRWALLDACLGLPARARELGGLFGDGSPFRVSEGRCAPLVAPLAVAQVPPALPGLEAGPVVAPTALEHCRRALGLYARDRFDVTTFGTRRRRGDRELPPVGAGLGRRFGGGPQVPVAGLPSGRLRALPPAVRYAFVRWAGMVGRSFVQLCSAPDVASVPTLGEDAAQLFRRLGFRMGPPLDACFARGWCHHEVSFILAEAGVGDDRVDFSERLAGLVSELIAQHMAAAGLRRVFHLEQSVDSLFGVRPALASPGSFWDDVEAAATVRLANRSASVLGVAFSTASGLRRLDWGPVQDRRSFAERWLNKSFESSCPTYFAMWKRHQALSQAQDRWEASHRGQVFCPMPVPPAQRLLPAMSWLQSVNEQWARGLVCLEGAQRAYLRYVHLGLGVPSVVEAAEPGAGAGKFWRELGASGGFAAEAVPAWRWYLLREAYLLSMVWSWAQFLHGDWAPLSPVWTARFRGALGQYSSLVGMNGRRANVPYWEGLPLGLGKDLGDCTAVYLGLVGGDFIGLDALDAFRAATPGLTVLSEAQRAAAGRGFRYKGKLFVADPGLFGLPFGPGLTPAPLQHYPVAGGLLLSSYRGPGRFHYSPSSGWEDAGGYEGVGMFGPSGREAARAFQLVANWFLAGHARYGSLRLGWQFREWVRKTGLSQVGLPMWGQFGLLDSQEWVESDGVSALFDGLVPGAHLEAFRHPSFASDNFKSWVGLGGDLLKAWALVERSPLSFPMVSIRALASQRLTAALPIAWFDRTLRALARGRDPVNPTSPLTAMLEWLNPTQDAQVTADFLAWRRTIWAPLLRVGCALDRLALRPWDELERWDWQRGSWDPLVESLWRDWMRPWAQGRAPGRFSPPSD